MQRSFHLGILFVPIVAFGHPESIDVSDGGDEMLSIRFQTESGHTHFVQFKDGRFDTTWDYLPIVRGGDDSEEFFLTPTEGKPSKFFRVATVPSSTGVAGGLDFDFDGFSNEAEVMILGTDPLRASTDGASLDGRGDVNANGISDGWDALLAKALIDSPHDELNLANIAEVATLAGLDYSPRGDVVGEDSMILFNGRSAGFSLDDNSQSSWFNGSWTGASTRLESAEPNMKALLEQQTEQWMHPDSLALQLSLQDFQNSVCHCYNWFESSFFNRNGARNEMTLWGYSPSGEDIWLYREDARGWADLAGTGLTLEESKSIVRLSPRPGELLSEPYRLIPDDILQLPDTNQWHSISTSALPNGLQMKEMKIAGGFDGYERFFEEEQPEQPWLMVPAGDPAGNQFKICGLGNKKLKLRSSDDSFTISPAETGSDDPLIVTVKQTDNVHEEAKIFLGDTDVPILQLVSYPRKTYEIEVYVFSFPGNDDEEILRQDGSPLIPFGQGAPNEACVRIVGLTDSVANEVNGVRNPLGDDTYLDPIKRDIITTGPNGICETKAGGDDEQVIPLGEGKQDVAFMKPGPNGVIDTPPGRHDGLAATTVLESKDGKPTRIRTGITGIRDTLPKTDKITSPHAPLKAEIEAYLDQVFLEQANVDINVMDYKSFERDADIGNIDPENEFVWLKENDGRIGVGDESQELSTDEQLVLQKAAGGSPRPQVFVVPTKLAVGTKFAPIAAAGIAVTSSQRTFVEAHWSRDKFSILSTIAHELGHLSLKELDRREDVVLHHVRYGEKPRNRASVPDGEHPTQRYLDPVGVGSTALKNLNDDRIRLMWPTLPVVDGSTRVLKGDTLIKDEWDDVRR